MSPIDHYNLASYRASLAGLTSHADSTISIEEGGSQAEQAMQGLRQAVAAGYHNLGELRTDTNLDSLRSHADFRLLLMDVAMPADPFAHSD